MFGRRNKRAKKAPRHPVHVPAPEQDRRYTIVAVVPIDEDFPGEVPPPVPSPTTPPSPAPATPPADFEEDLETAWLLMSHVLLGSAHPGGAGAFDWGFLPKIGLAPTDATSLLHSTPLLKPLNDAVGPERPAWLQVGSPIGLNQNGAMAYAKVSPLLSFPRFLTPPFR